MSKRIQSFGILCIVISMALCPFLSVYGANLSGQPYTSAYMPVCPLYPTKSQLPYGEDTRCVSLVINWGNGNTSYHWWFYNDLTYSGESSVSNDSIENFYGFFIGFGSGSVSHTVNIQSGSKVIHCQQLSNGTLTTTYTGTWIDNSVQGLRVSGYFHEVTSMGLSTASSFKFITDSEVCWNGISGDALIEYGVFGSINDLYTPYYMASYPDTVKQAVDSISDNTSLLNQYYTSLNSKLNSLSIDVQYIQGQNDELSSKVDELQSQLGSQSSEYQSALATAQSQIESNAQSAAQSAADDINNAGEDVSDIDDDMDDVNSIVETLDGWIDSLDTFADTIDYTAGDVADALDNASDFVEGFIGACPAIVIALFSFALVFLIVRKIIGR